MLEEERKKLYWALLTGVAKEAQDRMCAADQSHDWSPWHNTPLHKDIPFKIYPLDMPVPNETFRVRSDRQCLNCGKRETR